MTNAPRSRQSGFTLVEVLVAALVFFMVVAIVYSFYVGAVSQTSRAIEASEAMMSVLIGSESIRRDIGLSIVQNLSRDLLIGTGGKAFNLHVWDVLATDYWSGTYRSTQYYLEKVPGTNANYLMRKSTKGKAAVPGCLFRDMTCDYIPPGKIAGQQAYLQVTLVGIGNLNGKVTYTSSTLFPLFPAVKPVPYWMKANK